MMRIHALTVSVNYADFLALGLERWKAGLASWTIVTDFADDATRQLALTHGLAVFTTDVFYEHGAAFNKGAAMEQARQLLPREDWWLFTDADVVPEIGWWSVIEVVEPKPGNLYGCWRLDAPDATHIDDVGLPIVCDDRVGYGYFQLFHTSDPRAQRRPLLDTHWMHAGNYDSTFLLRWEHAEALPLKLWHIGGVSHNWFGRDRSEEFRAMERERMRRGGGWQSIEGEKIHGY
jgi:hypothetical protein